ncbi:MAG: DUF1223 domain-containing protein [Ginsengibacter sp.]
MKKILRACCFSLPLLTVSFCTPSSPGAKDKGHTGELPSKNIQMITKNIAVLELFTSQGCSSCPPADRLVGTYTKQENVIVLSFHVDYWDRLGWKDPFSSKEYTKRQYNYASPLNASVYTPQLVINGQTEMIGSDANKISSVLHKIFSEQPDAVLAIQNVNPQNRKLDISFNATGYTGNSIVNIALVDKKTTTAIKAGENGGITLTNYNVVRNFKTINEVNAGNNVSEIDIPGKADLKNMSVVIFLQQKETNKISAAVQVNIL